MRVLAVYPPFDRTYWGMEYTGRVIGPRAVLPPLGLLTVAALLPPDWEVRLCDLNVRDLEPGELAWADVVFLSGMLVQRDALRALARQARAAGAVVVCGGPYATALPDEVQPEVDCLVVGEAEELMGELCAALAAGRAALPRRLTASRRPDLALTPVPRYDLIDPRRYHSIGVQWSRGCPFSCEFCDIIELYGRRPRLKSVPQLLAELDAIYRSGHRGATFVVDDNFIGNPRAAKELLRGLVEWTVAHDHPFEFYTEASLNLARDEELLRLLVAAGFTTVFIGIETPSPEALRETHKLQNLRLDLDEAIATISRAGLEVMAGFIVGFDSDDAAAVDRQREWILRSPIPLAMTGLLMALPGTQLERRLVREGRMRQSAGGDNFARCNFVPRHDEVALLEAYTRLLDEVYEPEAFFARASRVFALDPHEHGGSRRPGLEKVRCFLASLWRQGARGAFRGAYWKFLARTLLRTPGRFTRAVGLAVQAEHFYRYTTEDVLPSLARSLAAARAEAVQAGAAAGAVAAAPPPAVAPVDRRPGAATRRRRRAPRPAAAAV